MKEHKLWIHPQPFDVLSVENCWASHFFLSNFFYGVGVQFAVSRLRGDAPVLFPNFGFNILPGPILSQRFMDPFPGSYPYLGNYQLIALIGRIFLVFFN